MLKPNGGTIKEKNKLFLVKKSVPHNYQHYESQHRNNEYAIIDEAK